MRAYYNPEHPERREKKRAKDRAYYQENEDNLRKNREKALAQYRRDPEAKKRMEAVRRYERKREAVAILGGKCSRCDEDHPAVLDFHHKDPALKKFRISDGIMSTRKYTRVEIQEEIEKCELLCKNCHGKEHAKWYIENGWHNEKVPARTRCRRERRIRHGYRRGGSRVLQRQGSPVLEHSSTS